MTARILGLISLYRALLISACRMVRWVKSSGNKAGPEISAIVPLARR